MQATFTKMLAVALFGIGGNALLSGCQAALVAAHVVAPWAGDVIDNQKAPQRTDTDAVLKVIKEDAAHAEADD